MPKGGKKSSRKSNVDIVADVKLSDFADTSARNGRLKKSIGNLNQEKLKDLCEEPLWYEKDLEDFKLLKVNGEDSKRQPKPVRGAEEALLASRPGVRYPPDLWFLLGGYIRPEQVRLFAAICKDAYHVSRSYSFWISMYIRHLDPSVELPPRLQCVAQQPPLCLRASVVRALHLCYPPFLRRPPSGVGALEGGLFCSLAWRLPQADGRWSFHFKFAPPPHPSTTHFRGFGAAVQQLWSGAGGAESVEAQVTHNPDAGGRLLRFSCPHFVHLPPSVMGRRLERARLSLAPDMRGQRLRLAFAGEEAEVQFDGVEGLAVLHWWHPHYPFDYF